MCFTKLTVDCREQVSNQCTVLKVDTLAGVICDDRQIFFHCTGIEMTRNHRFQLLVETGQRKDCFCTGLTIGLIKAVGTYRTDKNIKLATYASRCIENEILMYLRKNAGRKGEVSFDEPLNTDWDGNELLLSDVLGTEADVVMRPIEEDVERDLLAAAINVLSPREKQIITLRFGLGGGKEQTQKEVADQLGISQSYISRLEKRIISRLKKEILRLS